MQKILLPLLTCCLLALPAPPSRAADTEEKMQEVREMFSSRHTEEEYYRNDRLLVTATGSLVPVFKAPSVASVITKEDIEAMGATTLDEVLETVPGLHVGASSAALLAPIYSIRGIHTSMNPQVLMLYNGITLSLPNNGARLLIFRVPVANISRIEVVRGPGSAVHGADAFAGTINIITKDGFEIDGSRAGVRGGSFNSYGSWAQYGGQHQGWDVATSLEYAVGDGDDHRRVDSDLQSAFDNLLGTGASLADQIPLNTEFEQIDAHLRTSREKWTISSWIHLQDNGGPGAGVSNALTTDNDMASELFLLDLRYQSKTPVTGLSLSARLHYLYQHADAFYQILPPDSVVPVGTDGNIGIPPIAGLVRFTDGSYGNPQVSDSITALQLEALYDTVPAHRIRLAGGISFQRDEIEQYKNNGPGVLDSTSRTLLPGINEQGAELTDVSGTKWSYLPDNNRTLWNGSLQDEWSISPAWDLIAGIRYDRYSDFGETVNPRVALVWETRYDLTTKVMYGTAFRPPSFSEQSARNNPSIIGNPNLDPEKIKVWEIAFDYQPTARLRTVLSGFSYEAEDLIEYVQSAGIEKTAQNSKDQHGHGFELELRWEAADALTLSGNFAYQRSRDDATHELTADAPTSQLYLNARWRFLPEWSLNAGYFWLGDRHRQANDPRSEIDNYDKVDLILRRINIFKNWDFALAAKNLFDKDIREPADYNANLALGSAIPGDYPMEGRNIWAELRLHY